jgi:protein-S-isoprenylcysteine O-methyltransferase Ste14
MDKSEVTPAPLKRKVISIFSLALLLLVVVEVSIGWLLRAWGRFSLGWWNQIIAVVMIVIGIVLIVWSISIQYSLGKGTPFPKVATQQLITSGPYAYSRNPMTLGALLLYLGVAIGMGSIPVILLVLIIFTALLTLIYNHETRELTERFGEEYLAYQKRTAFLVPGCCKPSE